MGRDGAAILGEIVKTGMSVLVAVGVTMVTGNPMLGIAAGTAVRTGLNALTSQSLQERQSQRMSNPISEVAEMYVVYGTMRCPVAVVRLPTDG